MATGPSTRRPATSSETDGNPRIKLRAALKEDDTWKRYRNIVRNSWPTEFDGYEEEIMNIQKARPIRLLGATSGSVGGKKLVEATMSDQSYRSRSVEIAMSVYRVKSHLEMSRRLTNKHVLANYGNELTRWGLKGVRERETLVGSLFDTADTLITKYQMIMDLSDWVIADVDAGGFALQKAVKALELATKREYGP
jgi:hypothetical protein